MIHRTFGGRVGVDPRLKTAPNLADNPRHGVVE